MALYVCMTLFSHLFILDLLSYMQLHKLTFCGSVEQSAFMTFIYFPVELE